MSWQERKWDTPVLRHPATFTGKSALCYTIPARDARGNATLIPGEDYLLSLALRAKDLGKNAFYDVTMQADDQPPTTLVLRTDETTPSFDNPDGFMPVGKTPIRMPKTLRDTLRLSVGLSGAGTLAIQDVQFINIEAVEGSFTGRKIVREKNLGYFAGNDRDNMVVKPDNMFSVAGFVYLFTGLIPWKELWLPTLIWTSVILLLMLGFFGINVILRKHWVEHERVALPILRFYRLYFAGGIDEVSGKPVPAIWQNKMMWLGFACLFPIVMMKGLHYYYPAIPSPPTEYVAIDDYFTNPALKLFVSTIFISIIFSLLSIALLVEKDILFSVWTCYLLCNFFQFFGKTLNFNQINGYPWLKQQNIGSYFAYASLGLFAARKHLGQVIRHIFGRVRLDETREAIPYRTAFVLVVVSFAGLIAWSIWTEMGWVTGAIFFAFIFFFAVAASKIRAESSAFYHSWMPTGNVACILLPALGGFAFFSMKSMIVASLVGTMVFSVIFLAISPMQVEMFELGHHFKVRPRDIGAGLLLGVAGGMIIYTFVHLLYVYGYGGENVATNWAMEGEAWAVRWKEFARARIKPMRRAPGRRRHPRR